MALVNETGAATELGRIGTAPRTIEPEIGMDVAVSGGTVVAAVLLGVVAVAVAPLLTARGLRHMHIPGTLRVVE
jgi:hypothetical protein